MANPDVRRIALAAALGTSMLGTAVTLAGLPPAPLNTYFGSLDAYHLLAAGLGPREAFERARLVDRMDFLTITSPAYSSSLSASAASENARLEGRFVAMSGWRYSSTSDRSYVNVLELSDGPGGNIPLGRYDQFYRSWLPRLTDTTAGRPILQFGQPLDPASDYGVVDMNSLEALRQVSAPYVRTIQIAGGSCTGDRRRASDHVAMQPYLQYLNAGFRLAPTANPQNSLLTDGPDTDCRTAVLSRRLTKMDILDGIRQRRVYASEDRNLKVVFSINGQPMGSIVTMAAGTPLRIELIVSDPDEAGATYWFSLRRDTPGGELEAARELYGTDFTGDGTVVFAQFTHGASDEYFLARIVQESTDGTDSVWTAPIWLVSPPR